MGGVLTKFVIWIEWQKRAAHTNSNNLAGIINITDVTALGEMPAWNEQQVQRRPWNRHRSCPILRHFSWPPKQMRRRHHTRRWSTSRRRSTATSLCIAQWTWRKTFRLVDNAEHLITISSWTTSTHTHTHTCVHPPFYSNNWIFFRFLFVHCGTYTFWHVNVKRNVTETVNNCNISAAVCRCK